MSKFLIMMANGLSMIEIVRMADVANADFKSSQTPKHKQEVVMCAQLILCKLMIDVKGYQKALAEMSEATSMMSLLDGKDNLN